MRQTSRDYGRPYRPRAIALANRVLPRLGRLERDALLDAARARTGLDDFGPDDFLEPLDVLLDSIAAEARLSPVGHLVTRERLIGVLANRLLVFAAADRATREAPLAAPLVITGLQRTGTTLLQRLLASDPRRRWLASWEALHPAPAAGRTLLGGDRRIAAAVTAERALGYLAPDFFAVHPVQAYGPEEDVLLLDQAFRSTVPEATLRVPTYAAWLETIDQRPAYEHERLLLQVLSRQRGGSKRWLLKTPHHLEWLDVLLDVFEGARIVWTHRDPVVTVASFCSMVAHGRGVFSDEVDPREVGRDWGRKVARMVERALATRDGGHESAFVDVDYADLVRDPMAEVRRIYAAVGDELTEEAERRMRRTLASHPQHQHGVHRYALEDFGLDEGSLRDAFGPYRARFVRGAS
ncbi:MAG: sulfotransferase [Sandaracinaceae bacterium]|nr:sulfotransferase [Sandaracinaceae bacterium]